MKQSLGYSIKVWLTSVILLYVGMLGVIYYRLSQPNHPKEGLDPVFGTIVFLIVILVFLPSNLIFALLVKPIGKSLRGAIMVKTVLSFAVGILILVTAILMSLEIYPDRSYFEIGGCYYASMLLGIWIYRFPSVETNLIIASKE